MHPRVTSFSNFNFHESSWKAQTDATNAMAKTQEVLKSFTPKSHQKQQMLLGGEERKNKGGETQSNSQDLDPTGSPHLEEIWFGGKVDIYLLSLFPLKRGKNHGVMRRGEALKIATMEERESKNCC